MQDCQTGEIQKPTTETTQRQGMDHPAMVGKRRCVAALQLELFTQDAL